MSEIPVLFGLVLFGIVQGSMVTLVFDVLVTHRPKRSRGDVGSLRGATQKPAAAVGLAVALMVGRLSAIVLTNLQSDQPLQRASRGKGKPV